MSLVDEGDSRCQLLKLCTDLNAAMPSIRIMTAIIRAAVVPIGLCSSINECWGSLLDKFEKRTENRRTGLYMRYASRALISHHFNYKIPQYPNNICCPVLLANQGTPGYWLLLLPCRGQRSDVRLSFLHVFLHIILCSGGPARTVRLASDEEITFYVAFTGVHMIRRTCLIKF